MLNERYGLLLPNILDGDYRKISLLQKCQLYFNDNDQDINSVIFEIKPKWLYDNYTDNYCRTCSLNQLKKVPRHFLPWFIIYRDY